MYVGDVTVDETLSIVFPRHYYIRAHKSLQCTNLEINNQSGKYEQSKSFGTKYGGKDSASEWFNGQQLNFENRSGYNKRSNAYCQYVNTTSGFGSIMSTNE